MEKVIKDGMVAVLYSPRHGAGWYSWHGKEELLYDPVVVDMVLRGVHHHDIEKYCEEKYGDEYLYLGGASDLKVEWIPVGRRFIINEYDGFESIVMENEVQWLTA